jgi:hypothetical protein
VAHLQGDLARAAALHDEALRQARALGNRWVTALALDNLGLLVHDRGDYPRATAHHAEALVLMRALERGWGIARALGHLGAVALATGDQSGAVARYAESLTRYLAMGDRASQTAALEGLAAALGPAKPAAAARLLGAADALRATLGTPRPPRERGRHDQTVASCHSALGAVTFAAAFAEGQALDSAAIAVLIGTLATGDYLAPRPN